MILGNITVIEIGDPEIQQDVEEEGEIKDDKIKPVISNPDNILDIPVDPENEYGLDQKVECKY